MTQPMYSESGTCTTTTWRITSKQCAESSPAHYSVRLPHQGRTTSHGAPHSRSLESLTKEANSGNVSYDSSLPMNPGRPGRTPIPSHTGLKEQPA